VGFVAQSRKAYKYFFIKSFFLRGGDKTGVCFINADCIKDAGGHMHPALSSIQARSQY
jgi:hypothetical protein